MVLKARKAIVTSSLWVMLAAVIAVYFITERIINPLRNMTKARIICLRKRKDLLVIKKYLKTERDNLLNCHNIQVRKWVRQHDEIFFNSHYHYNKLHLHEIAWTFLKVCTSFCETLQVASLLRLPFFICLKAHAGYAILNKQ